MNIRRHARCGRKLFSSARRDGILISIVKKDRTKFSKLLANEGKISQNRAKRDGITCLQASKVPRLLETTKKIELEIR